ncbi:MAG: hypothetical protein GF308_20720 [Candidatus Heimdallarchaeota archaeon]|nr:hypothetical protein [Candidatus Heimdallarchaeota archaeon]
MTYIFQKKINYEVINLHYNKRILVGILLLSLFVPVFAQNVNGNNGQIDVREDQGTITITTDKLTLKITGGKPHFIWWNGNQSTADEMYKVHFTSISEFFGDDEILDSKDELNGISYNLMTNNWNYEIFEEETEVIVILTLSGLANNAQIQFIVHIYTNDEPIEGSDEVVAALSEVKIDIVIDNWDFSENAQGLALKSSVLEVNQSPRVRVRNGTNEESGNQSRSMIFQSEDYGNDKVAYLEWLTFAEVYNGTEQISTVDVGTAYFDGGMGPQSYQLTTDLDPIKMASTNNNGSTPPTTPPTNPSNPPINSTQPANPNDPPTEGKAGLIHFWFTYPNFGDSYKLVHDPSIGVYEGVFSSSVPLYILPVIFAFCVIGGFTIFITKRK